MPMPRSVPVSVATVALVGAAVLPAAPASAAATVDRSSDCYFEPGDVPGVDVFFPAKCTFVTSNSGMTTIIGRGGIQPHQDVRRIPPLLWLHGARDRNGEWAGDCHLPPVTGGEVRSFRPHVAPNC